jgi:hypothetical protein
LSDKLERNEVYRRTAVDEEVSRAGGKHPSCYQPDSNDRQRGIMERLFTSAHVRKIRGVHVVVVLFLLRIARASEDDCVIGELRHLTGR